MERPPASVRIEDLLAHREWVRRIARALVRDDARADDLEQEVWTSALERPPADRGLPMRGWLATVLRFRAVDQRRSEARRRAREESVAREERQPPADEIVARGEILRRLVTAVMDLEEPYRATVLLRYFEDQTAAAVAARQGVPLETVRTRLRRALDRLRERLDADHRGDRRAWTAMLLPLAAG
ncbi:MAG TPA: sigma-70 family RNA polymerase sigma factor, partial [Planctomycetota bacterium]|nr:sigma-70 family RNA polymerase sigma factor [Planctomycetota bacterium]